MKHRTFKLAIFLLLGALVNVAVAWGCALWSVREEIYWMPNSERRAGVEAVRHLSKRGLFPKFGNNFWTDECRDFGYERIEYYDAPDWWNQPGHGIGGSGLEAILAFTYAGWPCYSLVGEQWRDPGLWERASIGDAVDDTYSYHWSIRRLVEVNIGGPIDMPRPLPLRPTLMGFAINTIFYAGVLWMMFALPFMVRRHFRGMRIKRGLCPACAYPVGASPVCTECGQSVRVALQ